MAGSDRADDGGDDADAGDEQWRFGVNEVGEDGVVESERPEPSPVEPGSPSSENVVFFVAGVALAVGVFALLLVG
ncbi:hypothetical protein J2754_001861 [Halarchaeum solikamskense]|uniref:DUF7312 domain-containing protein n=1 Tax=Halarchaeum nitratireducens TaxID=489913 RepID=UPI001B3AB5E6|nr:hypothetical protein [Halarchaeum solikamskense]MBP2251530.1 hypothetical protein [Halarchaeum solikamskense]